MVLEEQEWTIEFSWRADVKYLGIIRDCLSCILRGMGVEDEDVHPIIISVDEACANVAMHAYQSMELTGGTEVGTVSISMFFGEDHVRITIADRGIGSQQGPHEGVDSMAEYEKTSFGTSERPHGLGIHIIRKCMDEVQLSYPEPSGTCLSMTKYVVRSN